MGGKIRIVAFDSSDHRATLSLRRAVLRMPDESDFTEEEIESERSFTHIALMDEDRAIACLALQPLGNGLVQVHQLSVRSDRRREGLGRRMMAFAEDHARGMGGHTVVFYARPEAVGFYIALGYVLDAAWFAERAIPPQMMAKRL